MHSSLSSQSSDTFPYEQTHTRPLYARPCRTADTHQQTEQAWLAHGLLPGGSCAALDHVFGSIHQLGLTDMQNFGSAQVRVALLSRSEGCSSLAPVPLILQESSFYILTARAKESMRGSSSQSLQSPTQFGGLCLSPLRVQGFIYWPMSSFCSLRVWEQSGTKEMQVEGLHTLS